MRKYILFILLPLIFVIPLSLAAQKVTHSVKPNIQHGVNYKVVSDITQYYVSEKLDGVRGYWNGKQLLTRQGNLIKSPTWFTQHWPAFPIDGELWMERDKFQPLLSCVSKKTPKEDQENSCWLQVRFMIFDLPNHLGTFNERVIKMRSLLAEIPSPYFAMITQEQLSDNNVLDIKLNEIISKKGEGLMVHLANAHYQSGRNAALMKLKKYQDAEAIITGYTKGKGKYQKQLGALEVKLLNGITFKIGSGFTDYQRSNPPKIGSVVTFKYNGLTVKGVPRFARFWRVKMQREDSIDPNNIASLADK